jgi:hypothetical protein
MIEVGVNPLPIDEGDGSGYQRALAITKLELTR